MGNRFRPPKPLMFVAVLVALLLVASGTGAATRRSRLVLPNLRPSVPAAFYGPHTNVDAAYALGGALVVDGCTVDEVARKLARRCLRFDTVLVNRGRGAFEVAYRLDPQHPALAAHQRIYKTDGTTVSRFAAETEYHPTHLHFHIKDIYVARLWKATPSGEARGKRAVARSDKNGFCPEDSRQVTGVGSPRHYRCFWTNAEPGEGVAQVVGISAGWADVYPYTLPDQFIEISSLKDGFYVFELEVDPHDYFTESSEADNARCILIRLDDAKYASAKRATPCP